MVGDMFKNENPGKPLSDRGYRQIAQEKGIIIARRTVAKYRAELNILPSNFAQGLLTLMKFGFSKRQGTYFNRRWTGGPVRVAVASRGTARNDERLLGSRRSRGAGEIAALHHHSRAQPNELTPANGLPKGKHS